MAKMTEQKRKPRCSGSFLLDDEQDAELKKSTSAGWSVWFVGEGAQQCVFESPRAKQLKNGQASRVRTRRRQIGYAVPERGML